MQDCKHPVLHANGTLIFFKSSFKLEINESFNNYYKFFYKRRFKTPNLIFLEVPF